MTKQIEDYPELNYDLEELRADHLSGDGLAPIEIDYLFQQIDSLTEQNSKMTDVMENNGWLSKEVVRLTEQVEQAEKDAFIAESKAYNETEDAVLRLEDEVKRLTEQNKELQEREKFAVLQARIEEGNKHAIADLSWTLQRINHLNSELDKLNKESNNEHEQK